MNHTRNHYLIGAPGTAYVSHRVDQVPAERLQTMVPPWFGADARPMPAQSLALVSPDGRLVSFAAMHPMALYDFLVLVGIVEGKPAGLQRMLAEGWRIADVELRPTRLLDAAEVDALLVPDPLHAAVADAAQGAREGMQGE